MSGIKRDCHCARVRHEHGTARAYDSDGCRCLRCALAYSRRKAAWKAGSDERFTTPHIAGTRRRLQALTRLGWSPREIAERSGLNREVILRLRNTGSTEHVLCSTRDVITRVYDELWNVPSSGPHRRRMVNLAQRKGWVLPASWDDDEIDDPNAKPHLSGLEQCGTRAAFKRHKERGERVDVHCQRAEREYQTERKRRQREQAKAAA